MVLLYQIIFPCYTNEPAKPNAKKQEYLTQKIVNNLIKYYYDCTTNVSVFNQNPCLNSCYSSITHYMYSATTVKADKNKNK